MFVEETVKIIYTKNLSDITEDMLTGFFVGWPNPPCRTLHLKILMNSYCSFVAMDKNTGQVVGFINAISDGVLTAYIPLLEVLPEYQGKGIRIIQVYLEIIMLNQAEYKHTIRPSSFNKNNKYMEEYKKC